MKNMGLMANYNQNGSPAGNTYGLMKVNSQSPPTNSGRGESTTVFPLVRNRP